MYRIVAAMTLLLFAASPAIALDPNNVHMPELDRQHVRKELLVPDILGMKTLKGDFHLHTIFSDGVVWPDVRVIEAWIDGLDAIAITDHIENRPDRPNVGGDHNAPYDTAVSAAAAYDILLVRGGEITRDMPYGHCNALFLSDVNALDVPDFFAAIEAAVKQGAFIQWNHPGWKNQQPDRTEWMEPEKQLLERKWLHGIEVFNSSEWYPVVLGWDIADNLAVMCNSDMHGLIMDQYDTRTGQRPMTLVFARERSLDSLREAMFAGRTAAWFGDMLAGKREYLEALFQASVSARAPHLVDDKGRRYLELVNRSDLPFTIVGKSDAWRETATLPPRASLLVKIQGDAAEIPVAVANCHTNLDETLETTLPIPK